MGLFSSLTKSPWERAKRKADKAARSGDPAAAFQHYGDALESCPEGERPALEAARNAAASELHRAHMQTARALREDRQREAAAERYELALRFAADDAQRADAEAALRELATASIEDEESAEVPVRAEEAEPVDPQAVFLMLLSDLPEEVAERYEALGDDFRTAYLAAQEGRSEEALHSYVALTALHPDSAELHFEHGNCLIALARHEEAVLQLERAEALAPDWLEVKLALAELAWKLERWPLAEGALQRAVDLVQDDPRVYTAIGRTALYTDSPEYGLEATEAGLELDPANRELILVRGQLLERVERDTDALLLYEQQVERQWRYEPETDRLMFDRDAGLLAARLYYRMGERLDRAEELMRAVIHVTPARQRWQYELLLAEILFATDQQDEGRQLAREASYAIPDGETLWRLRAADLAGDQEAVERLESELDDTQRAAWNKRKEGRAETP
jgi:tetratricopeptide (TPR) repeat protein